VEEVTHTLPFLSPNYQLIVERKGRMDSVKVEVEITHGTDKNNLDLKNPNSIPRSQGGKLSRILDNR